ncbi:MAG: hypothetical protein CL917_18160, partial [Deltaproteobacteria bacterium]|nr:hypothetical protein [Deltaproteobacteria bacterium]
MKLPPSLNSFESLSRSADSESHWKVLAAVLLLSLCLSLFFGTGLYGSDDSGYILPALSVLNDGLPLADSAMPNRAAAERLGMVLPTALLLWFWGENAQAAALSFVIFQLLLCYLTYLLGRAIHGENVGLWAATFTALCPLSLIYAASVLPDIPSTCLLILALIAGIRSVLAENPRQQLLLCFFSGVFLGLGYMIKESVLVMLPALGLVAVFG